MKYDAKFFLNVLANELNFPTHSFEFADAVEMSPIDAFRYVVFSNSGYIDLSQIECRLIIRKDLFRVFNQAEQENIQNGVYDKFNPIFKFTPTKYFIKYPRIMTGKKYVVFLEYDSNIVNGEPSYYPLLRKLNDDILKNGLNPFDFVVTVVPKKNIPKDLESFFEYYINESYRRKGYLTDSQLPYYYGIGTPDAGVYSMGVFKNEILKKLDISGATVIDLMCLKYLHKDGFYENGFDEKIVFEVKTGSTDGSQIMKYMSKDIFNYAFELIPHKLKKSEYAGLINFTDKGKSMVIYGEELNHSNNTNYELWLVKYIKCFLFANLTDDELQSYVNENNIETTKELINKITKLSIKEIINMVVEK